jgi:DNA invertase Pin-like site-specific DNA recombinase
MKTAIYVRAADAPDQVDDRLADLRETVISRGWTIAGVHVDRVVGSSKGRNRLPSLSYLLNSVSRHEVDVVMVWTVSHLGTSVDTLIDTLADLDRYGVKLVARDLANDLETSGLLVCADLLLDARRRYRAEAIRAGQIRARACGTRFGRPPVPSYRLERVRAVLEAGQGVRQAARTTGLSAAKVSRIRAEMVAGGLMV